MKKYITKRNDSEECWDLLEVGAATEGGHGEPEENAIIARFYDGTYERSPLAEELAAYLNRPAPKGL